ncbi:alpha/beta hydrolase [Sphingomonas mesophila]|uniref:alpha/beta hydrolase n=1 Tax=Sphingomonas mesophila TaxID=2303576 RepID=UPI0013C36CF0|nr:PHB depolymerase family esterase [Sphingomonas mesophila]
MLIAAWVALLSAAPANAATRSGKLETPPPATAPAAPETRSGVLTLAGGAYAYLPKGLDGSPRPLLVVLAGARDSASDLLAAYRTHADRHRFLLLIPTGQLPGSWDMIEDLKSRLGAEFNVQPRYGRDLANIDRALADVFARAAVDPKRIGVIGFSNGATYALSIGTANPQLFGTVIALSPGPAYPTRFDKAQRVFVSHGEKDGVLPFDNARAIVARMRGRGMTVEFERFDGNHEVPRALFEKAIAFFVAGEPAAP